MNIRTISDATLTSCEASLRVFSPSPPKLLKYNALDYANPGLIVLASGSSYLLSSIGVVSGSSCLRVHWVASTS